MKLYPVLFLILLASTLALTACNTSAQEPRIDWQIQYEGDIDFSLNVDIYNLDLFETSLENINSLHERDTFVICYISAGSWEDWRPDANLFPEEVLGNAYVGWPGEKWLDIREIDKLAPIMEARIKLAAEKGCDGLDPDNVDGFENDTGFSISYAEQLEYNQWLAETAHANDMKIGLKNDLQQVNDLLPYFDWALNEECFFYDECEFLEPFRGAGKPIFVIEYKSAPRIFCPKARNMGFNAIYKRKSLDAYRQICP